MERAAQHQDIERLRGELEQAKQKTDGADRALEHAMQTAADLFDGALKWQTEATDALADLDKANTTIAELKSDVVHVGTQLDVERKKVKDQAAHIERFEKGRS